MIIKIKTLCSTSFLHLQSCSVSWVLTDWTVGIIFMLRERKSSSSNQVHNSLLLVFINILCRHFLVNSRFLKNAKNDLNKPTWSERNEILSKFCGESCCWGLMTSSSLGIMTKCSKERNMWVKRFTKTSLKKKYLNFNF